MYIHELQNWTHFSWDKKSLLSKLAELRYEQGLFLGKLSCLGFEFKQIALLETLTSDILKSSKIEGEIFDEKSVRSSIGRRLGIDVAGITPSDRSIDGFVDLMLDATRNSNAELTEERLFGWHHALFPLGYSESRKIAVGSWRSIAHDPMQVISGIMGRETIHFEAPCASLIPKEMKKFIDWFNNDNTDDLIIKSGISHLWFLTIHPFEDGNGRIARALSDMLLSRSDCSEFRFYSVAAQIERTRKEYYQILEDTQKGDMNITEWLDWYLDCIKQALRFSLIEVDKAIKKSKTWDYINTFAINHRQRTIINKLIDGFNGKLSSSKYAKITKCSEDTALRDLKDLLSHGIITQSQEGGRSTHYTLADFPQFSSYPIQENRSVAVRLESFQ